MINIYLPKELRTTVDLFIKNRLVEIDNMPKIIRIGKSFIVEAKLKEIKDTLESFGLHKGTIIANSCLINLKNEDIEKTIISLVELSGYLQNIKFYFVEENYILT